jgi:3-hydroxyacyl-CoA dehydrogenase
MPDELIDASAPIAVIGAGTMGAGIAQVAAVAGHPVLVYDAVPGAAERAVASSAADIDTAMRLGTNYPLGPLAWGQSWGPAAILAVLDALHAWYGEDRYRASALLRRITAGGGSLL